MTLPTPPAVGDPATAALIDQLIAAGCVTASGSVTLTPTVLGTPVSTVVSFPAGRFSSTPFVFVQGLGTAPQTFATSYSAASSTGVTIFLTQTSGTLAARAVVWLAIDTP